MQTSSLVKCSIAISMIAALGIMLTPRGAAQPNSGQSQILSTGQLITPLAPQGARFQALNPHLAGNPNYTVGQAVTTVISPDGKTLLTLTSGYNLVNYTTGTSAGTPNPVDSTEFVFVFDISTGNPIQKQVLSVANTYSGIAFSPNGLQFFVSGGRNDDVHIFGVKAGLWAEVQTPVQLGHLALANSKTDSKGGLGLGMEPMAAGLAISSNGEILVVADYENDAVSILSHSGTVWLKSAELDLRPGIISPETETGVPGGEFPYWVSIKGNSTAYVSSVRDREIDVVNIAGTPRVIARVKVPGNPNRSVLSHDQSLLYVAQDNSDSVAVISTGNNEVLGEIKVTAPSAVFSNTNGYKGANPNSLTLSPAGKYLYVTLGGLNAVAVVSLGATPGNSLVTGLIPTGFYPNSVSVSSNGGRLYIVNGKSATGANPLNCDEPTAVLTGSTQNCLASNQFDLQLTKAGFQTVPTPSSSELSALTHQVIENDNFARELTPEQQETMTELHEKIQHVIYIVKENRSYDQVLGDLEVGNGDPAITQFGAAITPNSHSMALQFVDFDNFYDVADVSGDGWPWSTSARSTDNIEKEIPILYAGRGGSDNAEGANRTVNVGFANFSARYAADPAIGTNPNLLPGTGNVAAPDAAGGGAGQGYIWNGAHQAGVSVRNYGFMNDNARYGLPAVFASLNIPEDPTPYADKLQVAYPADPFLISYTDIYFRGFDNSFPDYYRFTEWNREFQQFESNGNLPGLSLVRFMHDHTGNFNTAISGVNTPEIQEADNDYAVGMLIAAVANSKEYSGNTLIFVVEDDAQDGGDHVNAHRSTAFIVGPYVKQSYVDSTFYNTVSMLRTIEDVLGIPPLNLNDSNALPMADAFDLQQTAWSFTAVPSTYLSSTTLPIPASAFDQMSMLNAKPLHNSTWWTEHTRGMDFSVEDHLDTAKYNRILWAGTMGDKPYPAKRSGLDLRMNRAELLNTFHQKQAADLRLPDSSKRGR